MTRPRLMIQAGCACAYFLLGVVALAASLSAQTDGGVGNVAVQQPVVRDVWQDYRFRSEPSQETHLFKELLYRRRRAVFYAFDLLWLDDTDLRQVPLIERKERLATLLSR
jgi:hypothetical protein